MVPKFTITYQHLNSDVKGVWTTNSKTEAVKQFTKLSKEYEIVDLAYRSF